MKRAVLTLISLVLAGVFALAVEPIRFGVLLEFTGGCGAYGKMAKDALDFARAVGLVPLEVLGRPIELIYYDAKTDPVEAAIGATRFVEMKVVAVLGPMCSGTAFGAAPILQKAGIPMIAITASHLGITKIGDYIFRVCPKDDDPSLILADLALTYFKAKTAVVVIDIAQPYCVMLGELFIKAFEGLGGKVMSITYVRTGDVDYTAQLTKIMALNPDLIFSPNYPTEFALMALQARDLGLKQLLLGTDILYTPKLIEIGKHGVECVCFPTFWWHPDLAYGIGLKYAEEYREYYGREPDAFGALAVDAYLLLVDAIMRAGSAEPKAIRDALATADLEGITGRIIMTPGGDPIRDFVFVHVKGGKFVPAPLRSRRS